MERLSNDYLFRTVNRGDLIRWARALLVFRFKRAVGGHANDGDVLVAAIRAVGWSEVMAVASVLGVREQIEEVVSKRGGRDSRGEPNFFVKGIEVYGVEVFVRQSDGGFRLELYGAAGDPYFVSEADFKNALELEERLLALDLDFLDPPVPGAHCVTPESYPELF